MRDVIIVGGGQAGCEAAIVLAGKMKNVLVIDDGGSPAPVRAWAERQGVKFATSQVTQVERRESGLLVTVEDLDGVWGCKIDTHAILFCTGNRDLIDMLGIQVDKAPYTHIQGVFVAGGTIAYMICDMAAATGLVAADKIAIYLGSL